MNETNLKISAEIVIIIVKMNKYLGGSLFEKQFIYRKFLVS